VSEVCGVFIVSDEDEPEEIEAPARLPGPAAAYATNWRMVLVVDAAMGVAVVLAGVSLAIAWSPIGGGCLGALGSAYVFLVVKRGAAWAAWRRDAGL